MKHPDFAGIYLLTHRASGRRYVGQSRRVMQRLSRHAKGAGSTVIARAIAEYGWTEFDSEVLERCDPATLNEAEARWVRHYRCRVPAGFNSKAGGDYSAPDFVSPKGQGKPSRLRQAKRRERNSQAGGKQICVMLMPDAVAALNEWEAAGYSKTQTVIALLEQSDPESNQPPICAA